MSLQQLLPTMQVKRELALKKQRDLPTCCCSLISPYHVMVKLVRSWIDNACSHELNRNHEPVCCLLVGESVPVPRYVFMFLSGWNLEADCEKQARKTPNKRPFSRCCEILSC